MSACDKSATTIGEDILPGADFMSVMSTDTITARSFTMFTDSIRSDNPTTTYLGTLSDPYFGTTTTEFVSQLRLGSEWTDDNVTVDSVRLYLTFSDVKGNINAGHMLRFSEISDRLYADSTYYSNRQVHLAGYSFELPLPQLQADTINDLELVVPTEFGNYLIRNKGMLFHTDTIPDFTSFFRGLYVQLIPSGDPVFLTMSIGQASTPGAYNNYFVLYMHNESDESLSFDFAFDTYTKGAKYNIYRHDYTAAEADKRFDHTINKNINDTLTYLQGMCGVYTRILLHGLDSIKNNPDMKGISVNRARLVYPYLNTHLSTSQEIYPTQLLMRYTDKSGVRYYVPDYSSSSSFFDGTIDTVAGVYNFNICTFVQQYLQDTEESFKPEVDVYIKTYSTQNVILRANKNSKPVKFEFTYTKF